MSDKSIWLNSALSSKLVGSEFTEDYNKAVENLRGLAKMALVID